MPLIPMHRLFVPVCFFLVGLSLTGCGSTKPEAPKTALLPEVSSSDTNFSKLQSTHPYAEAGAGFLTRTVFESDGPPGYLVEVRDLMVAPHKKAEATTFPGAAFLQVRYGQGVLTTGDKRQDIQVGSTLSVPQGQTFTLEDTSDQVMTIRVHLLKPR